MTVRMMRVPLRSASVSVLSCKSIPREIRSVPQGLVRWTVIPKWMIHLTVQTLHEVIFTCFSS